MVFHAPYPLGERGLQASGVRPVRMRQAFADAGYDVIEVTGRGRERARSVADLKRRLEAGLPVEFGYGENSTMPTLLTEPHHLPTHPLVDLGLLRLLRRHDIPTGMFYRDIYWRFAEYTERVHPVVAAGTRSLYHAELLAYRRWLDRVYLPSLRIADHVPHLRSTQVTALPPGGQVVEALQPPGPPSAGRPLTLLYVGNVSPYYRMHELVKATARTSGVRLLLCVPDDSWSAARPEYTPLMGEEVEVVHRSGDGLRELFAQADVCSLMVQPSDYRDFAAPVKLYEYLGYGKPVLASAGTLAARTVEDGGFGWSVPYDADELVAALSRLRDHPDEVAAATERVVAGRSAHSWTARARTVADDLAGLDRRRARD